MCLSGSMSGGLSGRSRPGRTGRSVPDPASPSLADRRRTRRVRAARDPAIVPTFPKAVFLKASRGRARAPCRRAAAVHAPAASPPLPLRPGRTIAPEGPATTGRLAQLVEHLVYTERVGGSSPSPPTMSASFLPHFSVRDSAPARVGRSRRRAPREYPHPQVRIRSAGSAAKRCQRSILRRAVDNFPAKNARLA